MSRGAGAEWGQGPQGWKGRRTRTGPRSRGPRSRGLAAAGRRPGCPGAAQGARPGRELGGGSRALGGRVWRPLHRRPRESPGAPAATLRLHRCRPLPGRSPHPQPRGGIPQGRPPRCPAPPPDSGPPASSDRLAILEDYADPFDVQETGEGSGGTSGAPGKVPENDGYMEPYEAQKMMAEIRGSKETAAQPLPLYDTPYEPEDEGASPEGEGTPWPRESRLPEDDERPPEEYDQPWEWKKERISKAFAAQFEGSEKNCLSPGREEKGRLPPRLSAGNPKSAKPLGMEPSSPLGEWTDPALPLENQVWYHGAISRTDAENLLRLCKEASYLVRNSETSKNDFSLSLKSSQGFMHMKLSRTKEHKYVLGQNSPPFSSVPEIVHHYASRKLPIKGAEHMSLLYPVAIRTL